MLGRQATQHPTQYGTWVVKEYLVSEPIGCLLEVEYDMIVRSLCMPYAFMYQYVCFHSSFVLHTVKARNKALGGSVSKHSKVKVVSKKFKKICTVRHALPGRIHWWVLTVGVILDGRYFGWALLEAFTVFLYRLENT